MFEPSLLTQLLWPETQTAVRSLRLEARLFTVQDSSELSATFEAIAQDNANGVLVLADALFNSVRATIIALAGVAVADHAVDVEVLIEHDAGMLVPQQRFEGELSRLDRGAPQILAIKFEQVEGT